MVPAPRLSSVVILAMGVLLVSAGFTTALGFSVESLLASAVATAALLYAGGTWGATRPRAAPPLGERTLIVFDRDTRIIGGGHTGEPVVLLFPEILRPEIERRCAAALVGTTARFPCVRNGSLIVYESLPVRDVDGTIICGILVTAGSSAAPGSA
jgi:hypothetical protein